MELGPGAPGGRKAGRRSPQGLGVLRPRAPLLTSTQDVVPEDRKMARMGQLEQVGPEARDEVGEAVGLCAEGAEGPKNLDSERVEAPPRGSCGRDPTLWCPPAGDTGCTPVWGF